MRTSSFNKCTKYRLIATVLQVAAIKHRFQGQDDPVVSVIISVSLAAFAHINNSTIYVSRLGNFICHDSHSLF